MNAVFAAGHVGEPSFEAFLFRVGTEYPRPRANRVAEGCGNEMISTGQLEWRIFHALDAGGRSVAMPPDS